MKRIYYLLMFLLCFGFCEAQYFSPGTQAQGHVDNKNYMVDYSTGTFYYSIPLFAVSSGNFNLPVNLSYAGRGRRLNDNTPGIVGYNWSLLHGGVITRSIRSNSTYEEEQEADLYTLSMNGQSHYFIKRGDVYEFLEKTNVRLRHEANDVWRVTDENGISYVFAAKEITRNAGYGEDFASSNVTVNEYVSAWYLTEIQIPNSDNIYFEYTPSYEPKKAKQLDSVVMGDGHYAYYVYGSGMVYYSFDEAGALAQAENYVRRALQEVYNSALDRMIDIRFRHMRQMADGFYYCVDEESRSLDFEKYSYLIENFYREYAESQETLLGLQATIMGVMMDFSGVPWVCQSMVDAINSYMQFIEEIIPESESRRYWALTYLRAAKDALSKAVCTKNSYQDKGQYVFSNYTVYTPHLKCIRCRDEKILFDYNRVGEFLFLQKIRAYDVKSVKNWEVHVATQNGDLECLTWLGKDGKKIQDMTFDYHMIDGGYRNGNDDWGYCSNGQYYFDTICTQRFNRRFTRYPVDDVNCKQGSLKTIHLPNGGSIEVDYEANRCNANGTLKLFGGIRLKQITVKDGVGNEDIIGYNYPNGGYLVYDDYYNWKHLQYPNMQDHVFWNRVKYKGNVYINAGNNGLLYDYVVEKLTGKGYNTYLFCVPRSSVSQINNTYPFWLCGIPLAKASYNESGNLVSMQKTKYYVDLNVCETNVTKTDWFTQASDSFLFWKKIDQKRISEYYMEPAKAREFYLKDARAGYLFTDYRDGFGAYYDPVSVYNTNVASRFGYPKYEATYKLYFGGKVLPEQQVNYLFSGNVSSAPSYQHLIGALPSGAREESRVSYKYDNNSLVSPTRVIQVLSNGDQLITRVRTPLDFAVNFNPIIRHMIDSNLLTPVIKKQSVLKKAVNGDNLLLSEQVTVYIDTVNTEGQFCFLPRRTFVYSEGKAKINPSGLENLDNNYYSVSDGPYRELNQAIYIEQGGKFFPIKTESQGKSMVTLYDTRTGSPFLSCQHKNEKQFGGMSFNPWEDIPMEIVNETQVQQQNYELLDRFVKSYGYPVPVSDNFANYRDKGNLKKLLHFIDCILDKSDFEEIKSLQQAIIADNMISEFVDSVMNSGIYMFWFPNPYGPDDFEAFPGALEYFSLMTEQQYNFMFQSRECGLDASVTTDQFVIGPGNIQGKYKLMTLLKPLSGTFTMNYKIIQGGSESSRVLPNVTVTPGKWQIVISEIDISGVQGSVSIKVDVPLQGSGIKTVLLVPENAVFEALSFNADGTVFCKFNQNGQMELNEYDAAGRLIRVKDRDGNVLNEYEYNTVFNN